MLICEKFESFIVNLLKSLHLCGVLRIIWSRFTVGLHTADFDLESCRIKI